MRAVVKLVGDFFLSAWIWNLTFDWFHPVITALIMFFILRFIFRRFRLHALVIAGMAQVFAFGFLSLIAIGLTEYLQWHYEPVGAKVAIAAMNSAYASLKLAFAYTLFQSMYFAVGQLFWKYNLQAFLVMVFLSNGLSFVLSYMFIEMAKVWYYID